MTSKKCIDKKDFHMIFIDQKKIIIEFQDNYFAAFWKRKEHLIRLMSKNMCKNVVTATRSYLGSIIQHEGKLLKI